MKRSHIILMAISLLLGNPFEAAAQSLKSDWTWINYPWAYSKNQESWKYIAAYGSQLWIYDVKNKFWEKVGDENPTVYFPAAVEFSSTDALEAWISDHEFGGFLDFLEYNGINFAVATRSFTSGLPTSDLSLFVEAETSGIWRRVIYKDKISDQITYSIEGSDIVFSEKSGSKVIFSFNLDLY